MANAQKKMCYFVDTVGTITVTAPSPIIAAILITPSAADSRVVIKESVDGVAVIDVKIESIESRYISFEAFGGIHVTKDFEIDELTNVDSVILYGFWNIPVNRGRAIP